MWPWSNGLANVLRRFIWQKEARLGIMYWNKARVFLFAWSLTGTLCFRIFHNIGICWNNDLAYLWTIRCEWNGEGKQKWGWEKVHWGLRFTVFAKLPFAIRNRKFRFLYISLISHNPAKHQQDVYYSMRNSKQPKTRHECLVMLCSSFRRFDIPSVHRSSSKEQPKRPSFDQKP